TITATETETVEGFVLDPAPQSILIREGEVQRMLFFNSCQGSIHISKIDRVTGQPLENAEFRITTVQGTPVDNYGGRVSTNGIYRTDRNGEISVEGMNPGAYTVAETRAPAGYVLDSQPQTVEVHEDDAQYLVFRNTPLQTLVIQKFADGTSRPLPGVTFLLTDADGRNIGGGSGEYTTDANGRLVVDGLEPGTVVVAREVRTVAGYHLNTTPQTIRIGVTGSASLMSAGASSGTSSVTGSGNTTGSGSVTGSGIATGTAVTGSVGTGSATGNGNSLTFYDVPLSTLIIHKVSEVTNEPLAGCEFYVTDGTGRAIGSTDGVYVTDEHGEITIRNLEIGTTVRVRETRTLPGYLLDEVPRDIEIQSSDTHELTFRNKPSQTLVVQKYVQGTTTPIPGTEFLITDSQGTVLGPDNGKFITDEDGRIVLDGLTPGMTVTARETKAADGYVYDGSPKSIAIRSGDAQSLTFYNTPLVGLTINKYENGTDHPLSGAAFLLTDGDGRNIGSGEYVTDANGRIFVDGLEPGLTVIAREVRPVRGYALNGAPQSIILKSDSENVLNFYDEPLSTLIIRKVIDGTNEPLSGVEFKVVDGSGANVGESDGVFYTDAQGEIVITGLEAGTVIKARETATVDGFVLDGTPKDIQIHSADVHELLFKNRRQGGLVIRKLISLTEEPLAGAEFRIAYADGRPVDNFNGQTSSGGIYTTNRNGEINITGITGT
ncbi:MAG: hypothetical protein J6X53_02570, partial [Abditibacteriota bacterium]|nr:hypothetical protein [Abditibacteriota bacterium]